MIDFTKDNKKSIETFSRYDGCLKNKADNTFYKLILNIFDKYQTLCIEPITWFTSEWAIQATGPLFHYLSTFQNNYLIII